MSSVGIIRKGKVTWSIRRSKREYKREIELTALSSGRCERGSPVTSSFPATFGGLKESCELRKQADQHQRTRRRKKADCMSLRCMFVPKVSG